MSGFGTQGYLILVVFAIIALFQTGLIDRLRGKTSTPEETAKSLQNQNAVLVDVRERDEVAEGMIRGALWIPLSELSANSPEAEKKLARLDRTKEIHLYCRSGNRSGTAAGLLSKRGFNTKNVGGYSSLKASGMETKIPTPEDL